MKNKIGKLLVATYPPRILLLAICFLFCLGGGYGTLSVTSDHEKSENNKFQAGIWGVAPEPGDVVINEIMWMGSKKDDGSEVSSDEWIELRNTTGHNIDVTNCNIYGVVAGAGGHLEIRGASSSDVYIIPAGGFFLIANKDNDDSLIDADVDLKKTAINIDDDYSQAGQIIFKDKNDVVLDSALVPTSAAWPAGASGTNMQSMQRKNIPGNGTVASNWYTCDRETLTNGELAMMQNYWDSDARVFNCGTPSHGNFKEP
jgi:hypothetical protein